MDMIFITAKANRMDSKTGLPIINYVECESMAEAGPYIGWMFSHGRTGGRRHHVKDLEALREDIRKYYGLDKFELVEVANESPET